MRACLSSRHFMFVAAMSAVGAAMPAAAVELDPAALVYKLPDQIRWNSAERRRRAERGSRR